MLAVIVFSKTNDKRLKWYYQLKGVSLYIDALEVWSDFWWCANNALSDLDQVNMLEDKANDSQKTLLMTLFWEFYGM